MDALHIPGSPPRLESSKSRPRSGWLFGLQWRITGALALGLVALFGAFSAIAYTTINQSTNAALVQRQAIAGLSAEAVDNLVYHVIEQMESVAGMPLFQRAELDNMEAVLEDVRSSLATVESLSLVDLSTSDVWTVPNAGSGHPANWLSSPLAATAIETGKPQVFRPDPAHLESGHPALAIVAVPVTSGGAVAHRVLVGDLHLRQDDQGLVPLPRFSETGGATIIDDRGRVLAWSNDNMMEMTREHFQLLADFLSSGDSGVAIHHPTDGNSHVVAFAPFDSIAGGVIVEEREDVVFAVPRQLRRNLILFGSLALALTSVAAWIHAWRTMRPIRRLTSATRAIAEGVLDQRVEIQRNDEIGVLAQSFEVMRQKLLRAERQRLRWEQEMEERVKERTERVNTLLARVISAQEEERKRVARELHDQVAQDLATSLITLQRLSQNPAGLQEADRSILEQAQNRLSSTLQEMRRMISDLRPSALDDLGLEAAIRGYAESRAEADGIRTHFETSGALPPMDAAGQTALFRIVQEAISNVIRHAEAEHLWIRLEFSQGRVSALVVDDGKGFDAASVADGINSASKLGIIGMRERAALLDGEVDIDSEPGHGTTVRVWIPLSA